MIVVGVKALSVDCLGEVVHPWISVRLWSYVVASVYSSDPVYSCKWSIAIVERKDMESYIA
jgi:hypothetical protein